MAPQGRVWVMSSASEERVLIEEEKQDERKPAFVEYHGQWSYMTEEDNRRIGIVATAVGAAIALYVVVARAIRSAHAKNLERNTVYYTYVTWWFLLGVYVLACAAAAYPRVTRPPVIWYRKNGLMMFVATWMLIPAWWVVWGVFLVGAALSTYAAYEIVRTNEDLPETFWKTFLNNLIIHVLNLVTVAFVIWAMTPAIRYAMWQQWMRRKISTGLHEGLYTTLYVLWHVWLLPQFIPLVYLLIYDVEKVYGVHTGVEPAALRGFITYLGLSAIGIFFTAPLLFYLMRSPSAEDPLLIHEKQHPDPVDDWLFAQAQAAQARIAKHVTAPLDIVPAKAHDYSMRRVGRTRVVKQH